MTNNCSIQEVNLINLPTVSIVIGIYNAGDFLEKCLNSVMQQTYRGNIECILVDNCSIDGSVEKASSIISSYTGKIKFRIIRHEYNKGAAASRNTGIKAAANSWIYLMDQDDWIVPQCIELMVACVRKYPQTQVVFTGASYTSGNYAWMDYEQKKLPEFSADRDWLQLSMLRRFDFGMTAWNRLCSREFLLRNNIFFIEGLIHDDEAWNFEMSKYIQAASFVKANTYVYNVHNNSLLNSATNNIRWKRLFSVWNALIKRVDGNRKQLQIRAISNYILLITQSNFPFGHRIELCLLFIKLGLKSCNTLSILFFMKGLLALLRPTRIYINHITNACIGL